MATEEWQESQSHTDEETEHKVDRLLDAIEFVKEDRRDDARPLLRGLIQEDSNFEDAWLWMSVAVDSLDQAIICLDNVLRINPDNVNAATALYRLRMVEMASEQKRAQLRTYRDLSLIALWLLILFLLFAMLFSSSLNVMTAPV
jgi:hypothetical protein